MSTNFLTRSRHKSNYYFRRRIPIDLKKHFATDIFLKSLHTTSKKIAVILARSLASQTDHLFEKIRKMNKKSNENFLASYIFKVDLNEHNQPTNITIDAQPEETVAVQALINSILNTTNAQNITTSPNPTSAPTKLFQDFIDEYNDKSGLKPTTKANYKSKLQFAKEFFCDTFDLLNVKQMDIVRFSEHVKSHVKNPTTQGLYIQIIVTFFNWHLARHGLPHLNSKTLIPNRKTPEHEDREGFSLKDMHAIIQNSYQYKNRKPHKWWATIATAFTGCRIEELCQMNINTDLKHDDVNDIWYIQIDEKLENDGSKKKSVKKLTSWRHLPIHSALVKHGFIDFLKSQTKSGASRPFEAGWRPRVVEKEGINKWSHYVSRWGGRELDKLRNEGLIQGEGKTYFHSMRHTIARLMLNAGVSIEISEAIAGRSSGSGEHSRYSKINNDYVLLYQEGVEKALKPLVDILESVVSNK